MRQRHGADPLGRGRVAASVVVVAFAIVLAGCAATPTASPSSTSDASPIAAASGEPTPAETAAGSPTTSAVIPSDVPSTPSPSPAPAVWSEPVDVGIAGQCDSVVAVIDGAGGKHLAAACDDSISYASLTSGGWVATTFKTPSKREDLDAQLAFQDDTLYLAYTRVAIEEGGCGDSGLRDVGVYYRTRQLPAGSWSDPVQIGKTADHLQAFRVDGDTIHATVAADDGRIFYERVQGTSVERDRVPSATGWTSLRVGDDGRARIAYESSDGLRYATFTGSGFTSELIPGTSRGYGPVLVLGANDQPYVLSYRGYSGGGCAEPDPLPKDGTYFSTKSGSTWTSERLTAERNVESLTVDTTTGRVHALVSGKDGVVYMTRVGTGTWTKKTVSGPDAAGSVIRMDPSTGALLVAYIRYGENEDHVEVITKP